LKDQTAWNLCGKNSGPPAAVAAGAPHGRDVEVGRRGNQVVIAPASVDYDRKVNIVGVAQVSHGNAVVAVTGVHRQRQDGEKNLHGTIYNIIELFKHLRITFFNILRFLFN
jgi:hypothetical protein